jgi:hypothetical protein
MVNFLNYKLILRLERHLVCCLVFLAVEGFSGVNSGIGPPGPMKGEERNRSRNANQNVFAPKILKWNAFVPVISETNSEMPPPGPESASAPEVRMDPTVVLDSYRGMIGVEISGLEPEQRVILEKYKVADAEVGIDADSILQGVFVLQDEFFPFLGEIYNFNVPGDENYIPGLIEASLDLYEPDVAFTVGSYVYRVRSPSNAYPPVDIPFVVEAEESAQAFIGTVTDTDGNPLHGAYIAVLNPLGDDNTFVYGVSADEDGDYLLYTSSYEEYDLVAAMPGYVGNYGRNVSHFILEDEFYEVDIVLTPGTRVISGRVVDDRDESITLPGVEVLLFSSPPDGGIDKNLFTVTWTDEEGRFEAKVTEGNWIAVVRRSVVFNRGYMGTGRYISEFPVANTQQGDVSDFDIRLTRGTSIIHGRLTSSESGPNAEPEPLVGVAVSAVRESDGAISHGVTDGGGDYRIAVTEGYWNVFAAPYSLQESEYSTPFPSDIKIGSQSSSVEYNFTARPVEAYVSGFLTDEEGEPISKLMLYSGNRAVGTEEVGFRNTDETDGYFSFGLGSGDWILYPDPLEAARRQLLFAGFPTVTIEPLGAGEEVPELDADFHTIPSTGEIVVKVMNHEGLPVQGISMRGATRLNGQDYHAYGVSDINGEARLASLDGSWGILLSDSDLRAKGYQEVPALELEVSGALSNHTVTVSPFENRPASLDIMTVNEDASLIWQGIGESGLRYIVEGSEDLETWRELGRVVAESERFYLAVDPETASLTSLFVRTRLNPETDSASNVE